MGNHRNFCPRPKEWDKPFKAIAEQEFASLKAQANEKVWVEMPRYIAWDKVDNTSPQSTPQVIPSFEEYTPPMTYPEEVEETLETPMKDEPLDQTKLKDVGLNNHNISLNSREVPNYDELEPQPQPLPSFQSLDVSLGEIRGPEPPIKPHSLDSFRRKKIDNLTVHTPPSPHMASFHPKDIYFYYQPSLSDPKKHYGFKSGLLGHSGSLGVNFSKLEMIEDDLKMRT
ncbi:hypothetical protein Tco_0599947 [Tanacetum coccineum]